MMEQWLTVAPWWWFTYLLFMQSRLQPETSQEAITRGFLISLENLCLCVFFCFLAETENALRLPDMDAAQQLKLRERQRFFEEAFQHDVDVYFSSAHLQIDYKKGE